MAELRRGSLLLSLQRSGGAEVRRDARALASAEEAAHALWVETECVRREARVQRERWAREAREIAERRGQAEEAHLAALTQITMHATRAEARAREVDVLEQRLAHERKMLELERARRPRRVSLALVGFGSAFTCIALAVGVYFGKLLPDQRRLQAAYEELVQSERRRAEETKRLLARSEARRAELARELAERRQGDAGSKTR